MMHDDEVVTDAGQMRRLLVDQFPEWADLPITALPHAGTDHALYRLGDDLVARLPRMDWALEQIDTDSIWLPRLAPHLPLPVPVPLAIGRPGHGYPHRWLVVPWLEGDNPNDENLDLHAAASQLAEFLTALQGIDLGDGPMKTGTDRGVPLAARDEITREAIEACGDRIDRAGVTALWEDALAAEIWDAPPTWLHGDLTHGNLLVRERRLAAVIDFSGLGLGDPAVDLMPAWSLFVRNARARFRDEVGCDDAMWRRGRGWALSTAVIGIPYYWDKAPWFVEEARGKLDALLAEAG